MKNKVIDYPHPVLNEYLKDFSNSSFTLNDPVVEESLNDIILILSYSLECPGIEKLINDGYAQVKLRISCPKTSYRYITPINCTQTRIQISKTNIADKLDIQALIIATDNYSSYRLPEFNAKYFAGLNFKLRKGDIIANEPGMSIKLKPVSEREASGIILVASDENIQSIRVRYPSIKDDDDIKYNDYILIYLPKNDYENYKNLRQKKYLKFGIERFLQASLILPALTEAISIIRQELDFEEEEEKLYLETVWAESIISALKGKNIDIAYSSRYTSYELANIILQDVAKDSINNLMKKMQDWSRIRQEEDI